MKVYQKVYDYYIKLMREGGLKPQDRMPSLRECTKNLGVSKTSAESGYLQLAADGYIYAIEKVGYFVTDLVVREMEAAVEQEDEVSRYEIKYDFATIGEDKAVSCLDLWRRYMKSALRQEERLLSYSSNQGERELREEISAYVRKMRNIICSPEDIVVGAGFQNLLTVLIPLLTGEKTVSFPTREFAEGAASFADAGFDVSYRNKNAHIINVTPAYMTKWGEVMPIKRRYELLEHSKKGQHIIIEDDYQNEFVFSSHPTPSLFALSGGENVVYISSFSRVLLPSVRISFMILPKALRSVYKEKKKLYNQSASKAEQIALAQFLRDGHMMRHIRKMRRVYEGKRQILLDILKNSFEIVLAGESGMEFAVDLAGEYDLAYFLERGIGVTILASNQEATRILLSCGIMSEEEIVDGIGHLRGNI